MLFCYLCLGALGYHVFKIDVILHQWNESIQAKLKYIKAGLLGSCFGAGSMIPRDKVRGVAMGRKRGEEEEKEHVYTGREKIQKCRETGRETKMSALHREEVLRDG